MATTNDLKNGIVLNLDGQLWTVTDFQHVKPGKGGAFVRTTLKNVLSGKVVDRTFNAGTKVETANVDKRSMTYLYKDGTELRPGDLLKLDFGATVDGYHSDMTRTLVLGEAADWQREVYELVAAAQAAGRAALAVGADVVAVDSAARDVIAAAGHAEHFTHGLGHGVGLEIHEAPGIGQLGAGRLAAGMAVTVEPGVYLPGHGGVRIEDTLIVTDDEPELLTLTSKELLVL